MDIQKKLFSADCQKNVKVTDMLKGCDNFETSLQEQLLTNLPLSVKKRICALKRLQMEEIKMEATFYWKVHQLECEFADNFKILHDKRKQIVCGDYEPDCDETNFPLWHGIDAIEHEKMMAKSDDSDFKDSNKKGVPEFWLTALKNVEILAEMIQEHDEEILSKLLDIDVQIFDKTPSFGGFTLVFHFAPNDFFSNSKLTKEYRLRFEPDVDDPYEYDGPEIVSCQGCTIDWKENKNVTLKLIKKKQKNKNGLTRYVTKQVQADSFFNFFAPPEISPEKEHLLDDDNRILLHSDFEIGQALRDRVIPRAVLYYTGEAHDEDSFDEGDEDEDDDSVGAGKAGMNGKVGVSMGMWCQSFVLFLPEKYVFLRLEDKIASLLKRATYMYICEHTE